MSLTQVPWQVLIILGALLTTVSLSLNKHQAHKGSALQVQSSKYLGSFSWVLFWWLLTSKTISSSWWMFYLYGMIVAVNLVVYTKAQRINMSLTSLIEPVGQLMGIILAALVLSEWKVFVGAGGSKLILAMILMPVLFWLFFEAKSNKSKKWLRLAIIYLGTLAIFKVIVKIFLGGAEAVEILVFQYAGSFTAATFGVLVKKQRSTLRRKFVLRGILQGWIGSSGIILLYTAIKISTVSETTLLRAPIVLLLKTVIGLLIFQEIKLMTKKKWIGVLVALLITSLVIFSV